MAGLALPGPRLRTKAHQFGRWNVRLLPRSLDGFIERLNLRQMAAVATRLDELQETTFSVPKRTGRSPTTNRHRAGLRPDV